MSNEKNDVVMLEQQQTRDDDIHKPVPIVSKIDYSGAHEARLLHHDAPDPSNSLHRKPIREKSHL
jgi:hypothetical protein